jgi:long-chain acyl-CoA synthetase
VGLPDQMKGETVKAFVVLRPGATASDVEIKSFCRERLAPYKLPSQIEFVTDLPKTQVGKVLRRELKQREVARATTRSLSDKASGAT